MGSGEHRNESILMIKGQGNNVGEKGNQIIN